MTRPEEITPHIFVGLGGVAMLLDKWGVGITFWAIAIFLANWFDEANIWERTIARSSASDAGRPSRAETCSRAKLV
jgi:hypothetical protein